jgi:hypothetical protein
MFIDHNFIFKDHVRVWTLFRNHIGLYWDPDPEIYLSGDPGPDLVVLQVSIFANILATVSGCGRAKSMRIRIQDTASNLDSGFLLD